MMWLPKLKSLRDLYCFVFNHAKAFCCE